MRGVPVRDAYNTLQSMFVSLCVSQFPADSRLHQGVLQAEPGSWLTPDDIGRLIREVPPARRASR